LLPTPPLRTGREGFPLHPAQAITKLRFEAKPVSRRVCFVEMNAELLEDPSIRKIRTPVRIEGIGFSPDLAVAHNLGVGWVDQPEPDRLAVFRPLFGLCRKQPLVPTNRMPVFVDNPIGGLFGMSAFGSSPQAFPNHPIHLVERVGGRGVSVVVDPAPNDGVGPHDPCGSSGLAQRLSVACPGRGSREME
jgi:hypothetical protein